MNPAPLPRVFTALNCGKMLTILRPPTMTWSFIDKSQSQQPADIAVLLLRMGKLYRDTLYPFQNDEKFLSGRRSKSLGTMPILPQNIYGLFLTHPPTMSVLNVSKNGHFLNPPIQTFSDVICSTIEIQVRARPT